MLSRKQGWIYIYSRRICGENEAEQSQMEQVSLTVLCAALYPTCLDYLLN